MLYMAYNSCSINGNSVTDDKEKKLYTMCLLLTVTPKLGPS